jgi:hypothetical protein
MPKIPTLIPVQIEQVDQLVLLARDLAGFVLLLDAAAIGDPTIAAVERILVRSTTGFRDSRVGSTTPGTKRQP